jgi:hypothetical protein
VSIYDYPNIEAEGKRMRKAFTYSNWHFRICLALMIVGVFCILSSHSLPGQLLMALSVCIYVYPFQWKKALKKPLGK